jgi:hypothetical protein
VEHISLELEALVVALRRLLALELGLPLDLRLLADLLFGSELMFGPTGIPFTRSS